jgi:hypothetical protein
MSCRNNPTNPTTPPAAAAPTSGAPPPCPTPCTITSQTVATSPRNRARTRIGVGEEVDLTVNPAPATWAISSGGGTLSPSTGSQTTVRYTAGDTAGSVTITATGSACSCTITFTVVEPSNWTMIQQSGTNLKHTAGRPDCGWKAITFFHPNDVNFYRIEDREMDSLSVATGCYNPSHHGKYHGNYPLPDRASGWFPMTRHSATDGTTDDAPDEVYSGYPSAAATGSSPPFTIGNYYWPIKLQWRVLGSSNIHDFSVVNQEHEIFSTGRCESRKGGHTEHTMYNDAASSY